MIRVALTVRSVSQVRFGLSAVWETAAAVAAWSRPREHPVHRRLRSLPSMQGDLTGLQLACDLFDHHCAWWPSALAPTPTTGHLPPLAQLAMIRDQDHAVANEDLEWLRLHRPELGLHRWTEEEYLDRLASTISAFWSRALAPLWERLSAIQEADIALHTATLASRGLSDTLEGVHPSLRLADGYLTMEKPAWDLTVEAPDGLWLVPSVFLWPHAKISSIGPVVAYAARGAGQVWEEPRGEVPSLAQLLGRSRAAILADLDVPRTNSSLSARLQLAPPTVSGHLGILSSTGLVASRRLGRRVLYARTSLGALLLAEASPVGTGPDNVIQLPRSPLGWKPRARAHP